MIKEELFEKVFTQGENEHVEISYKGLSYRKKLLLIFFYMLNYAQHFQCFEEICQNEFPLVGAHKLCIMSYVNEKLQY